MENMEIENRLPAKLVVKFGSYTGWEIYGYNASGTSGWSLGFVFAIKEDAVELANVIADKCRIGLEIKEAI